VTTNDARVLVFCSIAASAAGCSDSGSEQGPTPSGSPPAGCYPGEVEPCTCESGLRSVRVCLPDEGRGPCQCDAWGPGPGEFQGGNQPLPGVTIVKLPVFDVQADPTSDVFYVTVGSPAAEHEDSLVAVAPADGEAMWTLELGGAPSIIAVSDDASTAYVGLREPPGIARIDLARHTEIARYPAPMQPFPQHIYDMDVMPGAPGRVLVVPSDYAEQPSYGELVLLQDGAQVGLPPPFIDLDEVAVRDGTTAYGLDTSSTAATLATIIVSPTGYTLGQQTRDAVEDFTRHLRFDGEWLVVDAGQAIDPATHAVVGSYGKRGRLVSNIASDRTYIVARDDAYTVEISAFDRDGFTALDVLTLQGVKGEPLRVAQSKGGTLAIVIDSASSHQQVDNWLILVSPSALPGN
jgi:hypothetical protein